MNRALPARLAKAWASCLRLNTGRTAAKPPTSPSPNQKSHVTLRLLGSHLYRKLMYFRCCSRSVQSVLVIDGEIRRISPKEMRTSSCISHFRSMKSDCMGYTGTGKQTGRQGCDDRRESGAQSRGQGSRNELLGGLTGRVTRQGSEKGSIMISCWAVKGTWLSGISGCASPSQDCFWYSGECSQEMKNLLFF